MATKPCKFSYLRNWIDTGTTVHLECTSSRSGMSMAVYCRDTRIFTVQGCGFDRIGTAIGDFLEPLYQVELQATMERDTERKYASEGYQGCKLYGAHFCPDGHVALNGGCGVDCMKRIAKAIGLEVTTECLRNATLISLSRSL